MSVEDQVISWLASQDTEAYLVGGCVRDQVLGRVTHDLDVSVSSDGLALARRLADLFGGDYYPLDSERGTGRTILRREDGGRLFVDVASLRGGDIAADLAGRDFTINALAIKLGSPAAVIDYHGGMADLEAGLIRAVSEDAIRLDPVRVLRAFRQAAQLDFALDPDTRDLLRRDGAALAYVSAERVCDELSKLLACASSAPFLLQLDSLALLSLVFPELEPLRDLAQPAPHHHDALTHSLESVRALESILEELQRASLGDPSAMQEGGNNLLLGSLPRFADRLGQHLQGVLSDVRPRLVTLKMATLLHDVGKPSARTVDADGRVRFLGHEQEGSRLVRGTLERLRFSSVEANLAESIVRHHMRPLMLASGGGASSRALYRFFRDTQDGGIDILLHALADHLATHAFETPESGWQPLLNLVTRMLEEYWGAGVTRSTTPTLVNGHDLLEAFALAPGPQIGRLLEAVREAQAVGEISTRAEAMELVQSLIDG